MGGIAGVTSIGAGVVAVGGTVEEPESEKVEEGACGSCMVSVDCGMKSEREGRIAGFKKTLENVSAITFWSPLRCSMVQSNRLGICCHLASFPIRSDCLGKHFRDLGSFRMVNLDPVRTDLKCSNASGIAKSSLSKVE